MCPNGWVLQGPPLEKTSNCTPEPSFSCLFCLSTLPVSVNDASVLCPTLSSVWASWGPEMPPAAPDWPLLKAEVEYCNPGVMSTSEGWRMGNATKLWWASLWSKLVEGIYFLPPALGITILPDRYSQRKLTSTLIDSGWLQQNSLQKKCCYQMASWLTSQSMKTHQK